jgi:hypothetical protein
MQRSRKSRLSEAEAFVETSQGVKKMTEEGRKGKFPLLYFQQKPPRAQSPVRGASWAARETSAEANHHRDWASD